VYISNESQQVLAEKVYQQKLDTMQDTSVVSFYDNFGLIVKGSEDMVTKGIKN